jgi:2,5-furandicarboxylate decarboxylase 1
MTYPDLRAFLADLGGDLLVVKQAFDPMHEMAAMLRAMPGNGPAVLFENVSGHPGARVVGNLVASRRRVAKALDTSEAELAATYLQRTRQGIAPLRTDDAPVKEICHLAPFDLGTLLPVLTHYAGDGGPFVTTGVVLCTDPATGRRGMGIHRMMVKGGTRMGILLANPPLSVFLANAEATGTPLDIAVALGVEPALLIAAVVKAGPQGPDKMDIAGALRQAPVEMIRAETVAVDVPARAEIIIEGRILPGLREPEGPFGENTGYYFSNISPVGRRHRRHPSPRLHLSGPVPLDRRRRQPAVAGRRYRIAGPVAHADGRHCRSRPDHRHLRLHRRHCAGQGPAHRCAAPDPPGTRHGQAAENGHRGR